MATFIHKTHSLLRTHIHDKFSYNKIIMTTTTWHKMSTHSLSVYKLNYMSSFSPAGKFWRIPQRKITQPKENHTISIFIWKLRKILLCLTETAHVSNPTQPCVYLYKAIIIHPYAQLFIQHYYYKAHKTIFLAELCKPHPLSYQLSQSLPKNNL